MDKTVRKVTDLAEQRAETYRYWRSQPSQERFRATYELSVEMYRAWLGQEAFEHAQRSARTFVRIKREWR
jgi:cyclopropane fatty-acyl-phospholipid synthase-like methyltransferase